MNKSSIRNWKICSPKLWYLDDVRKHPELVALDGSVIPLKDAGDLPIYYPGTKLLNDKVSKFTPHGFENNDIILSVSKFWGLYAALQLYAMRNSLLTISLKLPISGSLELTILTVPIL